MAGQYPIRHDKLTIQAKPSDDMTLTDKLMTDKSRQMDRRTDGHGATAYSGLA